MLTMRHLAFSHSVEQAQMHRATLLTMLFRGCRGRGLMYRYQLQGYAKLIGVLKVVVYALLLNGISSSTSIAQVCAPAVPAVS